MTKCETGDNNELCKLHIGFSRSLHSEKHICNQKIANAIKK